MSQPPQVRACTPLQAHALTELRRLAARQQEYDRDPVYGPALLRMLRRAIYAAYRDCQDLGLQAEARELLTALEASSSAEPIPSC